MDSYDFTKLEGEKGKFTLRGDPAHIRKHLMDITLYKPESKLKGINKIGRTIFRSLQKKRF